MVIMSGQVVPLQANRKLESGARRSDWDSPRALMGRAAGQARGVSGILNLNLRPSLSISKFKFNLKLWSTAAAAAAGPPALPAAAGAAHHVSGLLCKALSRATSLVLLPDLPSRASRPVGPDDSERSARVSQARCSSFRPCAGP
jgi:hypothetical protein